MGRQELERESIVTTTDQTPAPESPEPSAAWPAPVYDAMRRHAVNLAELGEHYEALRQRDGDQPLPIPNNHPDVQSMVIADITARRQIGIRRYGTALQPHNGRDALRDAYEESLDLACYLRQAIAERDSPVVYRDADGHLTPTWPEGATSCIVAREVLDSIVEELNEARGVTR